MKKDFENYELGDEYNLSEMTIVPKGRYDPERRVGNNLFVLDPDIARAFPSDKAVNQALRLVLEMVKLPLNQEEPAETRVPL